ncbi:methyltransferase domain-containing protein [Lichenihabitans sp. Uapishka_5]|uniref:class I SAM-dependent methyltransferase n=1 Tax=Lichenihabitans sp. Uapishka_5 TaxID=3037302 RepID=UPI0029E82371|nr:methyltransferase domain-containing protein [Lichenihabitans sp. Uapishka_5]MDX7952032.1 methyltransferase domain-containing protein [Lichenihabitans sp. Uapishka_5]
MTALDEALAAAATGTAPDTVALMRILMEATTEAAARDGLAAMQAAHAGDAEAAAALGRVAALWAATPGAWDAVRNTVARIAHRPPGDGPDAVLTYWAASFDRLVAAQPEASVALYSLGSPAVLAAATDEIVALMDRWGLLAPAGHVLDLGCGIGRFLQALAPRVAHVTGLDISAGMVAEARRRCAGLGKVTVRQGSGRDLAGVADDSLDLVLAADVFPYLVEAGGGLAEAHVAEAARVLGPGGSLLILNYSYRGDAAADRAAVMASAVAHGFAVERAGTRDFALWDGAAFLLRRFPAR